MSTPTKAIPPLVGVDTYQSSISFGRCQQLVPTLGVDTYQSEYHLGRCQHLVLTLDVNTYLKGNAEWPTLLSSIRVQRRGRDHWFGGAGSSSSMLRASSWPRGRAKVQSALFLVRFPDPLPSVPEVRRRTCFIFSLHSRISLPCARDFWSREVVCWTSEQCFGGGFGAPA